MTENEAVEELKYDCNELGKAIPCDTNWGMAINEAYKMAISALENQKNSNKTVEEIKHFLEVEIEQTEERLKEPCYMFDGVEVSKEQAQELNKSHIRFCKGILRIIEKAEG